MSKMKDLERTLLLGDSSDSEEAGLTDGHNTIPTYQATAPVNQTVEKGVLNSLKNLSSDIKEISLQRQKSTCDEAITISWEHISVKVKMPAEKGKGLLSWFKRDKITKTILDDVNGIAKAGSLLVIMGSSGSGKTTLLNCLTRRNLRLLQVEGNILVNGVNIGENISGISGYIQQDDLFVGALTVREHLWFNAMLRLNKKLSDSDREERIEKVMAEMGLKKCEDTNIGEPGIQKGISGGEKKRLAFAAELLTKPSILFCDEPTSGLDSYTARTVVQSLKNLAEKGHTILCTIHQPSSEVFAMFDELLLMAEGRVAYLGSSKDALKFFSEIGLHCPVNYNPADFLINTLAVVPGNEKQSRETIKLVCNCFKESSYARKIKYLMDEQQCPEPDTFVLEMEELSKGNAIKLDDVNKNKLFTEKRDYEATWWVQYKMCSWRSLISLRRNRKLFPAKFLQLLLTALLLGSLYWQQPYTVTGASNMNGALFMLMVQGTFNLAYSVIMAFSGIFPTFVKEHFDRQYSVSAYYLAGISVDVPFIMFAVFIYITVSYWMIGLYPAADTFFVAAITLIILCLTAIAYGHLAASMFRDAQLSLMMLPFLLGTTLLFSGFLVKEGTASKIFKPIEMISSFRYSYCILFVNQWKHVGYLPCDSKDSSDSISQSGNTTTDFSLARSDDHCYTTGKALIYSYGYNLDDVGTNFGILILLLFVIELIAYFSLRLKTNRAK